MGAESHTGQALKEVLSPAKVSRGSKKERRVRSCGNVDRDGFLDAHVAMGLNLPESWSFRVYSCFQCAGVETFGPARYGDDDP